MSLLPDPVGGEADTDRPVSQPPNPQSPTVPDPSAAGAPGPRRPVLRALPRRIGVALLAIVALWTLIACIHQAVTGSFWLDGVPNPLQPMLFFAGPPVLLAAVLTAALAATPLRRADRVMLAACLAALLLIVLHLLLTGRTWLWVLPDLMPPLLFALLPLALLAVVGWLGARRRLAVRPALAAGVAAAIALGLGAGHSGLNLRALTGGAAAPPADAMHVVSWDTLDWNTTDPHAFFGFLTDRHADVYLLQDYANPFSASTQPMDDLARLRQAFPGYHVATAGDLLTISRYPILAVEPMLTNPSPPAGTANIYFLSSWKYSALRTDVAVGGRVVSLYNVHLYDRYYLNVMPLTPAFFRDVRGLDQGRAVQLDRLGADIRANANPVVVSGNFNILPDMGELGRLANLQNADDASRSLYPSTLTFFGLSLWQVDWTFASPHATVYRYTLVSPRGLSSHWLQDVQLSAFPDGEGTQS